MKSSKNFNLRSTGSDYSKQRTLVIDPNQRSQEENEMVYVRRPTITRAFRDITRAFRDITYLPNRSNDKKINNRFQK
jgi:hypothetical protein